MIILKDSIVKGMKSKEWNVVYFSRFYSFVQFGIV